MHMIEFMRLKEDLRYVRIRFHVLHETPFSATARRGL